jgi:GTP-binding protein
VEFVRSAATVRDLPSDGLPEIAFVGRSNVGKSSLINALAGRRVARTSATPGKTRLANLYRVATASGEALYLVDLPGYGFARGRDAPEEFAAITAAYFDRAGRARRGGPLPEVDSIGQARRADPVAGAVLAMDSRHPGLPQDLEAGRWLAGQGIEVVQVATKTDRLTRAERERHMRQFCKLSGPILATSARTGEGMDELWKAIDTLIRPAR